jgi:hypothetical protein
MSHLNSFNHPTNETNLKKGRLLRAFWSIPLQIEAVILKAWDFLIISIWEKVRLWYPLQGVII